MKEFLTRKDIVISVKRYGIDALGAMAQGLFCSLLIGTIINTLGTQLNIGVLTMTVATINDIPYTVGGLASAMSGPGDGSRHRLCTALSAARAVLSDQRRLCIQCAWRRRRPFGSTLCGNFCGRDRQGCFQGNENRYFGDPACDDWCRRCALCVVGACTWSSCDEGRQPDHVGDRSAAVSDGHFGIGARRRRTDLTDLVGGNLRGAAADRTGRRRCCSGLLRADGWLCSYVL